jgi:hypothetical protein
MEVSRGANLVGMSTRTLDARLSPGLSKKKKVIRVNCQNVNIFHK